VGQRHIARGKICAARMAVCRPAWAKLHPDGCAAVYFNSGCSSYRGGDVMLSMPRTNGCRRGVARLQFRGLTRIKSARSRTSQIKSRVVAVTAGRYNPHPTVNMWELNVWILIVKTSSMGDVVHTLPAVTDAAGALPEVRFDWLVEDAFAEIPGWHHSVERVIPVAIRRWRKRPWRSLVGGECRDFVRQLRARKYDLVIDAQGLIKSSILTRFVSAPVAGFARHSAREPLATLAYQTQVNVSREMHAVERTRQLFAKVLGYPCPAASGDFGLQLSDFQKTSRPTRQIIFVHATTLPEKHWPEAYWRQLCQQLANSGFSVRLPWGTTTDRERAVRIAQSHRQASVLPRLSLRELATELSAAQAVVAVDTGLGHLAAALGVPTVSLYGSTSPDRIGTYGASQQHLCAKNFAGDENRATATSLEHVTPAIVRREVLRSVLRGAA